MTAIYNTGTVSVTNGNAVVTGSGTAWAVSLVIGGTLYCAGMAVPILSVESDTSLTLALPWPGTTGAGRAYAIERENSAAANIVDLYDKLTRVLVQLSLAGITPNASGSIADRNALTLGTNDKGFLFLHAEPGLPFLFYRWNGTGWDGPFDTRGVAGVGAGGLGLPSPGAANKFPYYTGANTVVLGDITPAGRAILDDADAQAQRSTLGLVGKPIVILSTGQSNAAQRPAYSWVPPSNLLIWDFDGYVNADSYVGSAFAAPDGTYMSLGLATAARVAWENPTSKVYLFQIAYGGQPISHWLAGTGSPDVYKAIKQNVEHGLSLISVSSIDMMQWWQGEADAGAPSSYVANFATMMGRFRAETWFPYETPVVVHGVSSLAAQPSSVINKYLAACVAADPDFLRFVHTAALPVAYWLAPLYVHANAAGYYAAGDMAYHAWRYGTGRASVAGFYVDTDTGSFIFNLSGAATGRFVLGNNVPVAINSSGSMPLVQTHGTDGLGQAVYRWSNDNAPVNFFLAKSRGTSPGAHGAVQSGDVIGTYNFSASDGTNFVQSAASIRAVVDGAPSAGVVPSRIETRVSSSTGTMLADSVNGRGFRSMNGALGRGAPVTKTADFTVADNENWLICNKGSSTVVTLPAASSFVGREVTIKTLQAFTVVSASANVVPLAGGSAGTAILAATAGKWATLVSDGTNWLIMQAN